MVKVEILHHSWYKDELLTPNFPEDCKFKAAAVIPDGTSCNPRTPW